MCEELNDENVPRPRYCTMIKNDKSEEYGYNLHAEKGKPHFIGCVDVSGLAHLAGIRTGDRIYAVNGHSIIGENHKQVVQRIQENPLKCELLVLSEEESNWYHKRNIPIQLTLPNIIYTSSEIRKRDDRFESDLVDANNDFRQNSPELTTTDSYASKELEKYPASGPETDDMAKNVNLQPRLCHLEKHSPADEFGFNLHAEKNLGHFIGTVDKGGIGELAGLEMGQRIVGVNGQLVYPTTAHKDVVALIKMDPIQTDLLVASERVDRWYTDNHIEYSFDKAEIYKQNHNGVHVSQGNTSTEYLSSDYDCNSDGHNRRNDRTSENGGDDIFALNAEEARNRLAHQKKDPRRDTRMTLEEKYRLVSNM